MAASLTAAARTPRLRRSTPPQIRQRILYYYSDKEQVGGFVWKLTFAKPLKNIVCEIRPAWMAASLTAEAKFRVSGIHLNT
jgi:hypothetical protein